jgi:hypothetical protein
VEWRKKLELQYLFFWGGGRREPLSCTLCSTVVLFIYSVLFIASRIFADGETI